MGLVSTAKIPARLLEYFLLQSGELATACDAGLPSGCGPLWVLTTQGDGGRDGSVGNMLERERKARISGAHIVLGQ